MGMKCGCTCSKIAWILAIVGALNWGLIGIGYFFGSNWNVVYLLLGKLMWLEAIVYVLVGLSGLVLLFGCKCKTCKACSAGSGMSSGAPMGMNGQM